MSLHRVFYPVNAWTVEDKRMIAERITELYKVEGPMCLPPMCVKVIFTPVDKECFFVGGKVTDKCVRVHFYHREDMLKEREEKKRFMEKYMMLWTPFTKERGMEWEVCGEMCPPHLMRINGLAAPMPGSPAEKEWIKTNKVSPFQGPTILDLAA